MPYHRSSAALASRPLARARKSRKHHHPRRGSCGHARNRSKPSPDRVAIGGMGESLSVVSRPYERDAQQISASSVAFAAAGAALLALRPDAVGLIGCALAVQARLVCNLLDGMVAIEGGKKSAVGSLYSEFPDRIADSLLIVALGYGMAGRRSAGSVRSPRR
jgi:hypothetical protein